MATPSNHNRTTIGRKAFITGITGQDGSYLAELLLSKGYEVFGLIRRSSSFNTGRIDHLLEEPTAPRRLHLVYGDLDDGTRIADLLQDIQPDEIYNLGAQSHVRVSFDEPVHTAEVNALGTLRLLEAVRRLNNTKPVRFYQASTSEMYGRVVESPQDENTPFVPRSPYGCAKVMAHYQTINHREAYGLFACCGTLFNHESPRRGETFLTRKVTRAATRILLGLQDQLVLGNLDAKRDWGFAGDYVEAMWLMLQQDGPDDYVIATGRTHTVRHFVDQVFSRLGMDWERFVRYDDRYTRPTEVDLLLGDASKARERLGWQPRVDLDGLIDMMIEHDLELARAERVLVDHGHRGNVRLASMAAAG